jgi:hypothetical protein
MKKTLKLIRMNKIKFRQQLINKLKMRKISNKMKCLKELLLSATLNK